MRLELHDGSFFIRSDIGEPVDLQWFSVNVRLLSLSFVIVSWFRLLVQATLLDGSLGLSRWAKNEEEGGDEWAASNFVFGHGSALWSLPSVALSSGQAFSL